MCGFLLDITTKAWYGADKTSKGIRVGICIYNDMENALALVKSLTDCGLQKTDVHCTSSYENCHKQATRRKLKVERDSVP